MMTTLESAYAALCDLLQLAAAGACGREISAAPNEWKTVFRLAHEHQVVPLLGCALLGSSKIQCPEEYREYALKVMRSVSSANLLRKQRVFYLLCELKEAGIDAYILKGYAAARYYAYPECREAGDTDLLIDPQYEKKANGFLNEKGFQILERSASGHHAIAVHPKYGKVEMHVSLYNGIVEDIWFQDINSEDLIQETKVTVIDNEGSYETLGNTDQLLFMMLHTIKHFIGSGLTMRMLLDIALCFTKNREAIDIQRFWKTIEQLRYTGIVNGILSLLVQYGGFSQSDFPGMAKADPDIVKALVEDLLYGGYMGSKETGDRHAAAMIYNRKLALKQKGEFQYRLYMVLWKMKSATTHMFPSKELLIRLFPIVKYYPMLIPVLRAYQLVAFPIRKLKSGVIRQEIRTDKTVVADVTNRRMTLFKRLGMI